MTTLGADSAGAYTVDGGSGYYNVSIPRVPEGYCQLTSTYSGGYTIRFTPNNPTVVGTRLSNGYNTAVYEQLIVQDIDTGATASSNYSTYSVGSGSYRLPDKSIWVNKPAGHRYRLKVFLAWVDPATSRVVGSILYTATNYYFSTAGSSAAAQTNLAYC